MHGQSQLRSCQSQKIKRTVHTRSTTDRTSTRHNRHLAQHRCTRPPLIEREHIATRHHVPKEPHRLYVPRYILRMRACLEYLIINVTSFASPYVNNLLPTRIFSVGSAAARRPAVTQAAAPPVLMDQRTGRKKRFKKYAYLLRR